VHPVKTTKEENCRMRMNRTLVISTCIAVGTVALAPAATSADPITIDFESQPAGPSNFGPPPHTVSERGATISGGLILTNESASIDLSNVYATVNCCGYANPLSIVFESAVANLSVLITNNVTATYTLTDNLGHSASGSVAAFNTPILLTLPFEGITSATVASIGIPGFDFALGSLSFTAGPAPVPEPGSMLLVGGGMVGAVVRRRSLKIRSRQIFDTRSRAATERHSRAARATPLPSVINSKA
jgi:PEP-CTERM motif